MDMVSSTWKALPKVQELKQDSSSEDDMLVTAISSKAQAKSWNATLKIHSRDIKFKIDTGAHCNVITRDEVKSQTCRIQ